MRPTDTAQELAEAAIVGRICGLKETPGSRRAHANAQVVELMLSRFKKQAKREGMSREQIAAILADADDAVETARRSYLEPN